MAPIKRNLKWSSILDHPITGSLKATAPHAKSPELKPNLIAKNLPPVKFWEKIKKFSTESARP